MGLCFVCFGISIGLRMWSGEATDSVWTRDTHTHTRFACLSSQSIPLQVKLMLAFTSPFFIHLFSQLNKSLNTTSNRQLAATLRTLSSYYSFRFSVSQFFRFWTGLE